MFIGALLAGIRFQGLLLGLMRDVHTMQGSGGKPDTPLDCYPQHAHYFQGILRIANKQDNDSCHDTKNNYRRLLSGS
eukprot:scaffold239632_cov17-Prasinocladus_malaysianus.AAC.1